MFVNWTAYIFYLLQILYTKILTRNVIELGGAESGM